MQAMDILQDPMYPSTTPFSALLRAYLERIHIPQQAVDHLVNHSLNLLAKLGCENKVEAIEWLNKAEVQRFPPGIRILCEATIDRKAGWHYTRYLSKPSTGGSTKFLSLVEEKYSPYKVETLIPQDAYPLCRWPAWQRLKTSLCWTARRNCSGYLFRYKQANQAVWRHNISPHRIFLIWGIGGIGKTRLGKEVFLRLKRQYENTFYLYYKLEDSLGTDQLCSLPLYPFTGRSMLL